MLQPVLQAFPDRYRTYYEPFVGGAAVFFEMLRQNKFKQAVLGDSNSDLIVLYEVVQSQVDALISELRSSKYKYCKDIFLAMRAKDPIKLDSVHRAARFVYLMKTCFNGLYRVNGDGQFNSPFGRHKDPKICDDAALRTASAALRGVKLVCNDFEVVLDGAKKGDAVYFDPPYIPLSKTSSFTKYSPNGFTASDHWRLRGCFGALCEAGVRTVLSNSSAPLSWTLYAKDFKTLKLTGARTIGGPAEYRKPVEELLIIGEPITIDDAS
jgi:DNA adenine methylase